MAISPVYLTLTSSILSGRKKRDLASMIDPSVADKITPEMMQKIQELQVYNRRCEHNPLVEHTFFMRIFCRTLVLCRRWRNFWLPFRKKLIINNRLCPCIFLAPATHGKATFASIVFSANTAMPIQIFPMKNATSYPCMLSSPIGIFYFLVCKRNFHPNAYFFFVSLVSSACCTILCPTHLSRSSTSNV